MTSALYPHRESETPVRLPYFDTANAEFSLSQTLRRLAHASRRDALAWEDAGHYQNFASCMLEARRLWKDAKYHLARARMHYERALS